MDSPLATAVRGVLDRQVAEGRLPGYATALCSRGQVDVVVGGVLTLGQDEPVQPGTPFRLSSVTKVFGAVLALALVEDGTLGLEDEVRRWLPELAEPRVLRDVLGPLPSSSQRGCRGDCTSASGRRTGGGAGTAARVRRPGPTL